jgi:hypothetical protein
LPDAKVQALLAEHSGLVAALDRMRYLADRMGAAGDPPDLRRELAALDRVLQGILAHEERSDEAVPHPMMAGLVGGKDPLAAISRTHREIAHLERHFSRLVADLPESAPGPEDLMEMRGFFTAWKPSCGCMSRRRARSSGATGTDDSLPATPSPAILP